MDSIEEALLAIFIGIVVAEFLRKTSRVLQAIEVFKECLIKLHSQVLAIDGSLANTMFRALIHENNLCLRLYKGLHKYRKDCNDTAEKGWLHLFLAAILQVQSKFMKAWKFYESAIKTSRKR